MRLLALIASLLLLVNVVAAQGSAKLEGSFSRIFGIIGSNTTNSTTPVQWYNEAGPYFAAGLYALIVVPLLVVSFLALWSVQAPDRFLKPKKA